MPKDCKGVTGLDLKLHKDLLRDEFPLQRVEGWKEDRGLKTKAALKMERLERSLHPC